MTCEETEPRHLAFIQVGMGSQGSFLSSDVSGFKLSCRQITMGAVWAAGPLHNSRGSHIPRIHREWCSRVVRCAALSHGEKLKVWSKSYPRLPSSRREVEKAMNLGSNRGEGTDLRHILN